MVALIGITEHIGVAAVTPRTFAINIDAAARGIAIFGMVDASFDYMNDNGVSIDGTAIPLVEKAYDAAVETGNCKGWFLGTGLPPAGAHTLSMVMDGLSTADFPVYVYQLSGTDDLEIVDFAKVENDVVNPHTLLNYHGRICIAIGGVYSGQSLPGSLVLFPGMTAGDTYEFGVRCARTDYQTVPGSVDFNYGYTVASDDVAMVTMAISEARQMTLDSALNRRRRYGR